MRTARETYSKRATDTVQGFNEALEKPILENSLLPSMQKTRKGMKPTEVGTRSIYLQYCGRQNLRGRKKRSRPEAPQKSTTPESNKKWRRSLEKGKRGGEDEEKRRGRRETRRRMHDCGCVLWLRANARPRESERNPRCCLWEAEGERDGRQDLWVGLPLYLLAALAPPCGFTNLLLQGGGKNIKMS